MDNVEHIVKKATETILSQLHTQQMTLDMAHAIADAVKAEAKKIGVNAVIAIANNGGHPILTETMDDAFLASYDIAVNKAYTVVALKMSTSALKPLAQPGESLYGIQFTNQGKIVIFGGGDPLSLNNKIIGGLGVSGGTEEQDTHLSDFGRKYFESLYTNNNG